MAEYAISITDRKGKSIEFMLDWPLEGQATWWSLESGAFTYEEGVADIGYYHAGKLAWLALYGGDRVTDKKLVFHLDGFFNYDGPEASGKGRIYHTDHLTMAMGPITWQLIG